MRNITTPTKAVSFEDALRNLAAKLTGKPAASLPRTQEAVVQFIADNISSVKELTDAMAVELATRLTQELQNSMSSRPLLAGRVRMAMADSLCSVFAQEGYASFRAEYPDLSLKILTAGTGELLRMVNQNEADFIITLDSHIYNTEYVIRREKKVGVHFVAGPGCALAGQKEIPLKALIGQPFILAEQGMSYRRLMDEKLAGRSLEIQPVLEIGNTDHICALLEQGVGLSFLPDYVTDRAVAEGRLIRLAVEDFSVDIWQQLLYHRNKWVSPQMEAVMEHCAKTMF